MTDKLRSTFPISVTFSSGEQPTAQKLNSISRQSKAGLAILERAVGDLWNQSGDSVTSDYPNRITNLARTIGDGALLNTVMPLPDFTGITELRITQDISSFASKSVVLLDFVPINDSTLEASVQALTNTSSVAYTGSSVTLTSVDSNTEWNVDTTDATLSFGTPLHSGTSSITYNVAVADMPSDASAKWGFNVIPHPDQLDWEGLKIVQISAGKYWLMLPFRRPLTASQPVSKIPRQTGNEAVLATPTVKKYWGPPTSLYAITSGVSDVGLYRYSLPEIVRDMFGTPVAGQEIPGGTLHLFDNNSESIVEGLTFKIPDVPIGAPISVGQVPWIIQVEGLALDALFAGLTSSQVAEESTHYQSRFSLICVGQSVSQAINEIKTALTEDLRSTGIARRIDHKNLVGGQPAQQTRHPRNFASYLEDDGHPQYLSRNGSDSSASIQRDRYNNAMMGPLLMGSTASGLNYQNLTSNSQPIWFNAVSTGTSIYNNPTSITSINGITSSLTVDAAALKLNSGILIASEDGGGFLSDGDSTTIFSINRNTVESSITAGMLSAVNSTTDIDSYSIGTAINWLALDPTSGITNKITFKSKDLNLVGTGGDTNDVLVGSGNANTSFRLVNNKLEFGTTVNNDKITFSTGDNVFTFAADGSENNSTVLAGIVTTAIGVVNFGSPGDDSIIYDDGTKTYSFVVDNVTTTSKTIVGTYEYATAKTKRLQGQFLAPMATETYVPFEVGGSNFGARFLDAGLANNVATNVARYGFEVPDGFAAEKVVIYFIYNEGAGAIATFNIGAELLVGPSGTSGTGWSYISERGPTFETTNDYSGVGSSEEYNTVTFVSEYSPNSNGVTICDIYVKNITGAPGLVDFTIRHVFLVGTILRA